MQLDVNPEVVKRGEAGEAFDVAVGNPSTIEQLIASGKVVAGSRVDIGRSGLGVAVRAGAAKPDISSVEAFKRTLLAAKAVAFPAHGASGLYFVGLVDRLGSRRRCRASSSRWRPKTASRWWRAAKPTWSWWWRPAWSALPGVDVVGPIPEALQTKIGFAAGLSASTKQPEAAKALIRFLSAPAAAATLKAKGVEPAS